jgi:hypothetical protein
MQWIRTDDQDRNEIQRCLSRRNNTIQRFDCQWVPVEWGVCERTTRFLAEPSDSAMALS